MSTLEDLRKEAGLSQSQLARASGVTKRTIKRIENDPKHMVYFSTAKKLIDALNEALRAKGGHQVSIEDVDGLRLQ